MFWNSHLFKNFPQVFVIQTFKVFGIVSEAEVDVFLELSSLFNDPTDVGNLISGSCTFPNLEPVCCSMSGSNLLLGVHTDFSGGR